MSPGTLSAVRALVNHADQAIATLARAVVAAVAEPQTVRRLNMSQLVQRLHRDPSTIARDYRAGRFPRPEYLGMRRVWREDVIEEWERERAAAPQVRKPRGVAAWSADQHRAREAATREKKRLAREAALQKARGRS